MMNEKEKIRKGKFLSLILRHEPSKINLTLDQEGWAAVTELLAQLAKHQHALTREELEEIVATNNKKRYSFNQDHTKIRANQGHSLTHIDLGLVPQIPPKVLYHGTATRFLGSILEQGLVKGSRQHVHLSSEPSTARKVGMRHGNPVILRVDAEQMQRDGGVFYCSENGVWLTDHVPVQYLQEE
ncbi:RNA 2'-phosphotransferase [Thiofilum flexile]|uniref:RNA 2'-phosphotransferase n=1 Tax=Thiofilum flexile TaxID=125627 RepID=UPI00036A803D|nr:RNA 2'-phosphotransferase [Thiofilum flexile]